MGLLHHAAGERGIERRQAEGAVLENFDELAAGAEEQHGAELRVGAAADDELVAVELDHGLDGDAQEVFLAHAFRSTEDSIAFQARRTAAALRRLSCTPPTSVLWVMVSE